jgi:integrase
MLLIAHVPDPYQLMAQLMYGSGLRLMECLRLRVKDVDFAQQQIIVSKGCQNDHDIYSCHQTGWSGCA